MKSIFSLFRAKGSPPSRRAPFKLTWANPFDVSEPGAGIELGVDTVVFGTEVEPRSEELELVVPVRGRDVAMRVAVEEKPRFVDAGKLWYRVRAKVNAIAADDYDLLVRELTGTPEPTNRAFEELQSAAGRPDDDYRLLPIAVQQRILALLVAQHRLDPLVEGQLPMIRMRSLGKGRDANGTVWRKVNITSRRRIDDQVVGYNTLFLLDGEGNVALQPDP